MRLSSDRETNLRRNRIERVSAKIPRFDLDSNSLPITAGEGISLSQCYARVFRKRRKEACLREPDLMITGRNSTNSIVRIAQACSHASDMLSVEKRGSTATDQFRIRCTSWLELILFRRRIITEIIWSVHFGQSTFSWRYFQWRRRWSFRLSSASNDIAEAIR